MLKQSLNQVLIKVKEHYYYNIFLEKCSHQLAKKITIIFFHSIIMFRFGETKVTRETFCGAKQPMKI